METLRFNNKDSTLKKQECLTHYFNGGEADWGKVVTVVAEYPFSNIKLACEIAGTHMKMDKKGCLAFIKTSKQEL